MAHQLHDGGGGGGIYVPTSNGKTPINPNLIPGADIDPDTIETQAASIVTGATAIRDNGASVLTTWQGLSAHYTAPEQHLVLGLVDPVGTETTTVGDDLDTIAGALNGYAEDIRPIKTELDRLRQEAIEFIQGPVYNGVEVRRLNPEWTATQSYYGGYGSSYSYTSTSYSTQQTTSSTPTPPKYVTETVEWHEDQATVDQNNALINAVNAQQVLMWEVERTWANKIRALWGGAELHAYQSENDLNGYGLDEIPEGTEMPWGTPSERTEGCAEATINNVFVDFLWEGVIVGGIWGTITGLGTLVLGYNPQTGEFFSGEAYGMAWSNLGMLAAGLVMNATPVGPLITAGGVVEDLTGVDIVPDAVQDFYNGANETLLETGKSLIAWDKWADDPWTAAGETTFNLGTILIPGGAAVAGIKGAGAAASVLARMARVVDFIDPGAWAFNGAVRIGGLGADGIRTLLGDLSRLENPDLPVRFTSDDPSLAINQLVDDLGVDPQSMSWSQTADGAPVLEFPGGAVEFPAGTFDDVVPASTVDDLVPAGTRTEAGDGVNSSVVEPPVSQTPAAQTPPGAPAAAAAASQGSTLVADPVPAPSGPLDGPSTGNGTGSSSSSGETGSGSGSGGDGGGPTSGGDDVASGGSPEQPMSGPEHRGDAVDPAYGEPRAESGTLADAYAPPVREGADGLPELDTSQLSPEVRDLVQDPAAPFGRDPQTQQPFTKAEWESRYMGPDDRPIYPGNDGAAAGSRVEYSDPAAYFAEHGPTVDRLGGDGGTFFGRVGDGFESRALPGSNLSAPYTVYRFADEWPPNMRVEVSEIAPAFGQPGGGTQFRVMLEVDGNWVDVPASQLVDDGILIPDKPAGSLGDAPDVTPTPKPDNPGAAATFDDLREGLPARDPDAVRFGNDPAQLTPDQIRGLAPDQLQDMLHQINETHGRPHGPEGMDRIYDAIFREDSPMYNTPEGEALRTKYEQGVEQNPGWELRDPDALSASGLTNSGRLIDGVVPDELVSHLDAPSGQGRIVNHDGVLYLEQVEVRPFDSPGLASRPYDARLQISEQAGVYGGSTGARSLTIQQLFENLDSYQPRSVVGDAPVHPVIRQQLLEFRLEQFQALGMSDEAARALLDVEAPTLALTHGLDGVAGGNLVSYTGLGNTNVNSGLGGAWGPRAEAMVNRLNEMIYGRDGEFLIDPSLWDDIRIDLNLWLKE